MPLGIQKKKKRKKRASKDAVPDAAQSERLELSDAAQCDQLARMQRLIAEAVRVVVSNCSCGRSGQDTKLWDSIRRLPCLENREPGALIELVFAIGHAHGHNMAMRHLVRVAHDAGSYSAFCHRCGMSWREHEIDGSCTDKALVCVPVEVLIP